MLCIPEPGKQNPKAYGSLRSAQVAASLWDFFVKNDCSEKDLPNVQLVSYLLA